MLIPFCLALYIYLYINFSFFVLWLLHQIWRSDWGSNLELSHSFPFSVPFLPVSISHCLSFITATFSRLSDGYSEQHLVIQPEQISTQKRFLELRFSAHTSWKAEKWKSRMDCSHFWRVRWKARCNLETVGKENVVHNRYFKQHDVLSVNEAPAEGRKSPD